MCPIRVFGINASSLETNVMILPYGEEQLFCRAIHLFDFTKKIIFERVQKMIKKLVASSFLNNILPFTKYTLVFFITFDLKLSFYLF